MSAFDDFMKDAGGAPSQGSLADQFAADVANPNVQAMAPRPRTIGPPQELSALEKLLSKVPSGLVNNPAVAGARVMAGAAAAPMVGGAQLIANMMPESTGVPKTYNQKVAEFLRKNESAAKEAGPIAAMANEFAGGVISPINLAMAGQAPALTTGARAVQGAQLGTLNGLTAPVDVAPDGKFFGQKAAQTVLGAGTGTVVNPAIGAIADRVTARLAARGFNPANAAKEADEIISSGLKESGQSLADVPADQLSRLQAQVTNSLQKGQKIDAAALMRMQDFKTEGITPTAGWVSRDPAQWEAEQNVRGVKGAGEKVRDLIVGGNRSLTEGVNQFGAGASEVPDASLKLAAALKSLDDKSSAGVTAAYTAARKSAGKDLDVPLQGLAQDYENILGKYSPNVRNNLPLAAFESYGLGKGEQSKVFTFEEADKLLKTINANKSADPATQNALGELRDAVKRATTDVDATGGPFAPAVAAARARFKTLEDVPALSAASDGRVDDRFVQKYVIGSTNTEQVKKLAALLKTEAPEAFDETRRQIGADLSRRAFGENTPGDKLVAQERYNAALRKLGTGKLEAFFSPEEVEQMKRLGRIASYQTAPPAGSASNYSNTASAIANLLRAGGGLIPIGGKTVQFLGDKVEARGALNPQAAVSPNISPEQRRAIARALTAITGGGASMVPGVVGQ